MVGSVAVSILRSRLSLLIKEDYKTGELEYYTTELLQILYTRSRYQTHFWKKNIRYFQNYNFFKIRFLGHTLCVLFYHPYVFLFIHAFCGVFFSKLCVSFCSVVWYPCVLCLFMHLILSHYQCIQCLVSMHYMTLFHAFCVYFYPTLCVFINSFFQWLWSMWSVSFSIQALL